MENLNIQDEIILKKSKRRLRMRLIATYIFLIVYFIVVYIVTNIDLFKVSDSMFRVFFLIMAFTQLVIFALLFIMLDSGEKKYRTLYWIVFFLELVGFYYPLSSILSSSSVLGYTILTIFMIVKTYVLYQCGKYLQTNPSSMVVFEHTIEVDEDGEYEEELFNEDLNEEVPVYYHDEDPVRMPSESLLEEEEEEYVEYTYPQLAVRLGICIYGSLMLFPILTQIFSSFFMANDMKHIFATQDGFMLCLFTAVIWTLPLFYLYFDNAKSKRIVILCLFAEVIRLALYIPTFISYIRGDETTYPVRVFIIFGVMQIIRYALLIYVIKPIFEIEVPQDEET